MHTSLRALLAFHSRIWHFLTVHPDIGATCGTMMSGGTTTRGKSLWAQGKARLLGRGGDAREGRRVDAASGWLIERQAAHDRAEGGCCRVLIAGGEKSAQPQAQALILGRALAESLARVILIDLSQGAGALSGPLELPRAPGFAELCQQKASFEDAIKRDPASGLHFLASGKPRNLGGEWGGPGMLDKVCRAIDESYAVALFCAEHDEALMLARGLKRPFAAGVIIRRGGHGANEAANSPAGVFETFGFPLYSLDQRD
jgi:hypothetical protein